MGNKILKVRKINCKKKNTEANFNVNTKVKVKVSEKIRSDRGNVIF